MAKWRVLVTDYTWESTEPEGEVLARVGAELVIAETGSEEELARLASDVDAILFCFAQVPGAVLRAGPRLQVAGRYGIGVDNIDIAEASRLGILVTNVPSYCLDEVSDHAMALLLACARKTAVYDSAVKQGNWSLHSGVPIHRLRGKTLGLLGFGKIGQTLSEKARGFGLRLIAHDPFVSPARVEGFGVQPVDLDFLFSQSDYLSVHAPLNAQTQGLINEQRLRQMKETALLINTSRGQIIDEAALVRALQEGWISGAGLDVFSEERLPPDHPLLQSPKVVATPHVAFYSEESLTDLQRQAAENVALVLSGRKPSSILNPEVLDLPRWAHLA